MTDVLEKWQGCEYVPLPEIADAVGLDQNARSYAVRHGVIPVAPKRGRNGRYLISMETAALVVAAALFAAAAGIAIVTALRGLLATGAVSQPSGVTIPLGVAA